MFTRLVTFVSKLGANGFLWCWKHFEERIWGSGWEGRLEFTHHFSPCLIQVTLTGASRPRVFKRSIHKELRKISLSYSLVFCVLGRAVLIHLSSSHTSIDSQAVSAQSKSLSVVLCKVGAGVWALEADCAQSLLNNREQSCFLLQPSVLFCYMKELDWVLSSISVRADISIPAYEPLREHIPTARLRGTPWTHKFIG